VSEDRVYRRGDVLWRQTYDRVLIVVPGRDGFLTLETTGCALWAALDEPGPISALAERLAAIYGASVEDIASDIVGVIEDLERVGAVSSAHPGDGL
jgi:hypothetical protein